jgi:hypothetical protein
MQERDSNAYPGSDLVGRILPDGLHVVQRVEDTVLGSRYRAETSTPVPKSSSCLLTPRGSKAKRPARRPSWLGFGTGYREPAAHSATPAHLRAGAIRLRPASGVT